MKHCACKKTTHATKLIVITGGPGAGKTAALEMARAHFCEHVCILPEAATILFSGGFFREKNEICRKASQRAIYHIQVELEQVVLGSKKPVLGLCDRGTVDGLAYWMGSPEEFWSELGTNLETELAKYSTVIHLKTPTLENGYNHQNPYRIESAIEASIIDQKIGLAWAKHPNVVVIESEVEFVEKVRKVLEVIHKEMPECCRV